MRYYLFTLLASTLFFNVKAQYNYPTTKTVDSSDTYFGVNYKDPYRWLENLKQKDAIDWFKQEAEFASNILNKIPGRDKFLNEINELDKLRMPVFTERSTANGKLFYLRINPGETASKIYFSQSENNNEQLLFDPSLYAPGKNMAILNIIPSHKGDKVIVSYSFGGSEIQTIRVMDVANKKFLADSIYPSRFGPFDWTNDDKAFAYSLSRTGDITTQNFKLNTQAKLHVIGTNSTTDIDLLSKEAFPSIKIKESEFPILQLPNEAPDWVIGNLSTVNKYQVSYTIPSSTIYNKNKEWKQLCKTEDSIVAASFPNITTSIYIADAVYAISSRNAPYYKLLKTSISKPDWEKAEIIAAEKQGYSLENIINTKNYLYLVYNDGINKHLFRYSFKTKKTEEITLPFVPNILTIYCPNHSLDLCYIAISSPAKTITEFVMDGRKKTFTPSPYNFALNFPDIYNGFEVKEVEVKAHDGVMIPLTITYKKGTVLNGEPVCILRGYGAYGAITNSSFNIPDAVLMSKGVVTATAHVRGGGEKGEVWRLGGYKTTKPNTWKDFISCAEYLIEKGYTSKDKLGGIGTSAGGILIGRAITERPDLFAAVVCNVGLANTMRIDLASASNTPEFGTTKDSVECKALYEMDAMQHVQKNVKYPAILCVAGWNDTRVLPWQPAKFAAALQQTIGTKPMLLKVNYNNGHFSSNRDIGKLNFIDMLSFLLWQCGHPEFQIRK